MAAGLLVQDPIAPHVVPQHLSILGMHVGDLVAVVAHDLEIVDLQADEMRGVVL